MNKKVLVSIGDRIFPQKELMLRRVFEFVRKNDVQGDYLEFGVWKGRTFLNALRYNELIPVPSMRFFGFDSFEGLPETTEEDQYGSRFQKGEYRGDYDLLLHQLRREGFLERSILVKGWFQDTLTSGLKKKHNLTQAAIIWVDSDLYSSAKMALAFVTDLLVDGTVLIFDDWFLFKGNPRMGEQKAFFEWIKKHKIHYSEFFRYGWGGISFVIHKNL